MMNWLKKQKAKDFFKHNDPNRKFQIPIHKEHWNLEFSYLRFKINYSLKASQPLAFKGI
jgi:hypothetical protein